MESADRTLINGSTVEMPLFGRGCMLHFWSILATFCEILSVLDTKEISRVSIVSLVGKLVLRMVGKWYLPFARMEWSLSCPGIVAYQSTYLRE